MCRRSLSLIWPCTKQLARALKYKLFPEGGGGGGRYSNKLMVKSSNAQSIAWGREGRGNVGAWNCRMHYVRYLKIILKIISRNKFKKSLFIWLSTQPQIRRSFDYYFMAHLWWNCRMHYVRYLKIILKIISRNKFKKSLFIWLSTQPQIRRSFDYYFMAHLWSRNSLPVYRYLNILLLFLVLLQS